MQERYTVISIRIIQVLAIFLLICQAPLNAQWIKTNGPYGGRVLSFTESDSYILAGTHSGGVYRSSDNGVTWIESNTGLTNKIVWSLATSGSYVFAGTSIGVCRSSDNGASWTMTSTGLPNEWVLALTVSGTDILAGTWGGVFMSTNFGESWLDMNEGLTEKSCYSITVSDTNIFAGTTRGVFRFSKKNGNWIPCGLDSRNVSSLLVSDTNLFAGTEAGVYRTSDMGATWTRVNTNLNYKCIYSLISFGGFIFAGDIDNGIFRTSNNGESWNALNDGITNTNINCISTAGSILFIGTNGGDGIYRSLNYGEGWIKSNTGLNNTYVNSLSVMPEGAGGNYIFAGTYDGVFRSDNDGEDWILVNNGLTDLSILSFGVSGKHLFAGTENGIFHSDNYGSSWTPVSTGLTTMEIRAIVAAVTRTGDTCIFAGTYGGGVFCSDNNASGEWQEVNSGLTLKHIYCLAVLDTNIFAGGAGISRSTDNGENWYPADSGLTYKSVLAFAILPGKDFIWAGTYGGGAFVSADNGKSWTRVNSGLPNYYFLWSFAISGTNIFGAINGVCLLEDINGSWKEVNTGLGHLGVRCLIISGSDLYGGTQGGGVWKRPLSDMITSVKSPSTNLPANLTLSQNYPNPFHSVTDICFSIPSASFVSLRIFNTLGREVATLVEDELPAGTYTKQWNAKNISSGIYFYRLQAGDRIETKRLLIAR
jgi:photosystem II stability/assembly factor-like uncharacterized protein